MPFGALEFCEPSSSIAIPKRRKRVSAALARHSLDSSSSSSFGGADSSPQAESSAAGAAREVDSEKAPRRARDRTGSGFGEEGTEVVVLPATRVSAETGRPYGAV